MMALGPDKPSLAVFGLGQYFRKLRPGLDQYFELVALADVRPFSQLGLPDADRALFMQVDHGFSVTTSIRADAFAILTPPSSHVSLLEALAPSGKPILVEKPLVTSPDELPRVEAVVSENARLYCSDFYSDVRGLPLRIAMGQAAPEWAIGVLDGAEEWAGAAMYLGQPLSIDGRLLEGEGPARSFEGRDWLWDPKQGGVLSDLLYHYVNLLSWLYHADLQPQRAALHVFAEGAEVPWQSTGGLAETRALVEGRLGPPSVDFRLEVAKYHTDLINVRSLAVSMTHGQVVAEFGAINSASIHDGRGTRAITLRGDYYKHVGAAFLHYVETSTLLPYGLEHAMRSVRAIDHIRRLAMGSAESLE